MSLYLLLSVLCVFFLGELGEDMFNLATGIIGYQFMTDTAILVTVLRVQVLLSISGTVLHQMMLDRGTYQVREIAMS